MVTLLLAVFGLTHFITQGTEAGFFGAQGLIALIRNFSGASLGSFGMNFRFWPFVIYLPIYFQNALECFSLSQRLLLPRPRR